MTQFSPGSFLLKTEVQGFYLRLSFQLATPPGFHATHIPEENLVLKYYFEVLILLDYSTGPQARNTLYEGKPYSSSNHEPPHNLKPIYSSILAGHIRSRSICSPVVEAAVLATSSIKQCFGDGLFTAF